MFFYFHCCGKKYTHTYAHTYIYTCIDIRKTKQDKKMKGEREGWVQRDEEVKEIEKKEERGKEGQTQCSGRETHGGIVLV